MIATKIVKVGKKGQLTIPKAILRYLGLKADTLILVEATSDGAILLRPMAVYPTELYTDQRVAELADENSAPDNLLAKVDALVARRRRG